MAERSPSTSPPSESAGPFASSWRRRHLTVDERVARGLAARQEVPRSSHGRWEPAPDRPDPVALLEQQAASRVPDLVPIRHGRMLASPFTFYRGAALIMAADLAATLVRREVRVKRVGKTEARAIEEMAAKARTRDSTRVFARRAEEIEGELRIVADPPVIIPIEDMIPAGSEWENPTPIIKKLLSSYRRTLGRQHHPLEEYRYVHSAYKMVGVGSVGTRCYIMLLTGRDHNDPLFLQVKEAQLSVLERFLGASTYSHHGERVVAGQRLMQAATDIFLGWQRIKGLDGVTRDYYVRQFHDWKGSADVETLLVPGATLYARICGATLARAHARWGDRIAIASCLGKGETFDRAMADFSAAYADQNERDYAAFAAAVDSGRLAARTGV
jgi:hypothetical protein